MVIFQTWVQNKKSKKALPIIQAYTKFTLL